MFKILRRQLLDAHVPAVVRDLAASEDGALLSPPANAAAMVGGSSGSGVLLAAASDDTARGARASLWEFDDDGLDDTGIDGSGGSGSKRTTPPTVTSDDPDNGNAGGGRSTRRGRASCVLGRCGYRKGEPCDVCCVNNLLGFIAAPACCRLILARFRLKSSPPTRYDLAMALYFGSAPLASAIKVAADGDFDAWSAVLATLLRGPLAAKLPALTLRVGADALQRLCVP